MPESSLARARNAASSTISTAQAASSTPGTSLAAPRASRADTQVLRIEHVGARDFELGALAVHGRESGETPSDAPPAAGHEGESHPAPELDRGGRCGHVAETRGAALGGEALQAVAQRDRA